MCAAKRYSPQVENCLAILVSAKFEIKSLFAVIEFQQIVTEAVVRLVLTVPLSFFDKISRLIRL